MGNKSQGRKNSTCKGPEAGAHLAYFRNSKEARVAAEVVDGEVVENEVTEETRARPCGALQAIIKDLGFNFKLTGEPLKGSE